MNSTERQQYRRWHREWAGHLGMSPMPLRSESNRHYCDGELWGQPCGQKRDTEGWFASQNCPAWRIWNDDKPEGVSPRMWWSNGRETSRRSPIRGCPPGVDPARWVDGHPVSATRAPHLALAPPAADHERWWRHEATGALLYTSEPFLPVHMWRERSWQYAQRVTECLGLHVAYGRPGRGYYAEGALLRTGQPVNSMTVAISMDRALVEAVAACECVPFDFTNCRGRALLSQL